jgi:hypothetical protein
MFCLLLVEWIARVLPSMAFVASLEFLQQSWTNSAETPGRFSGVALPLDWNSQGSLASGRGRV